MTGLELILTGLCIAALAWATVCHVRMLRAQRFADLRQKIMHKCLSTMQKLVRQRRALKHGVRAVAKAEAETRDQARQWVQMYNACNERAEGEFYRGYQAHKRQVADDLLGLAERYEEAARQ